MRAKLTLVALLLVAVAFNCASAASPSWKPVEDAIGVPGTALAGGIFKITIPRSDLHVTVDGVQLAPAFALTSWLAFRNLGADTMVMGDFVLAESEVAPAMAKLVAGGIAVTALHNHLLRATPPVMYMHVSGMGDATALAHTLHDALATTTTPLTPPEASPEEIQNIDTAALDGIMGATGQAHSGVYSYSFQRRALIAEDRLEIAPAMGTGIGINFQPIGKGAAAVTGDFVLVATEVAPVMHALMDHKIEVTALHNHMLNESPRSFFMHFWAKGDATSLAQGLRAALDKVDLKRGQ